MAGLVIALLTVSTRTTGGEPYLNQLASSTATASTSSGKICEAIKKSDVETVITPADKLAGRAETIWAARRERLAAANARRRVKADQVD